MTQFAQLLIAGDFATGVTYYEDYLSQQDNSARMVLNVSVDRRLTIEAVLDTGAPWCILDPALFNQFGLAGITSYDPKIRLIVRGIPYTGQLLRMSIGLLDEYGQNNLDVDATVFVPSLIPGDIWNYPNFIGLDGFLSRIRFAVDPAENAFYFGPLG